MALALIGDPELLFLDEPTTGFDPSARRRAWEVMASLRELGKTVFLTTHYMEEAQALADRVAIIADGRIVAAGPAGRARPARRRRRANQLPAADGIAGADLPHEARRRRSATGTFACRRTTPSRVLHELTSLGAGAPRPLAGLEVRRPSLEDVYLRADRGEAEERGGMSGVALALHQFRFDQKTFWRNPASVFFTVMLPVIFLLIFATIFGNDRIEELGGSRPPPTTCPRSSPSPWSPRRCRAWRSR